MSAAGPELAGSIPDATWTHLETLYCLKLLRLQDTIEATRTVAEGISLPVRGVHGHSSELHPS